jgi:hypothetical protein
MAVVSLTQRHSGPADSSPPPPRVQSAEPSRCGSYLTVALVTHALRRACMALLKPAGFALLRHIALNACLTTSSADLDLMDFFHCPKSSR